MPARIQFFEILKDKVWHKTKETQKKKPDQLLEREYIVLKELTENGNEDFAVIDKKYNFSVGASQYTYQRLIAHKIIYRTTITMEDLPFRYIAISKCSQLNINEFNSKRDSYLLDVIQETNTPINKYILIGDIGSPSGLLYITPIFKDGELDDIENNVKEKVRGSEIESYIITKTLVGKLGFRRIDNKKSAQYSLLPIYKQGYTTAHAFTE